LQSTVHQIVPFLEAEYGTDFEVIIITNHAKNDRDDGTEAIAAALALYCPQVRVVDHQGQVGKGAALRTGFHASLGEWIFFVDSDLPYDLGFFTRAAEALRSGAAFVTGNRRVAGSEILCETRFVFRFVKRLCMGKLFNRVLRTLLPIQSTDTQAGIKAMTREFAQTAFALQSCPGFYFDIELFLTAAQQSFRHAEVPLRSNVTTDVSTVRFFHELQRAIIWLSRIWWRNRNGEYAVKANPLQWSQWQVSADDWGLSPAVNRGILHLAQEGVVRRASVMVDAPFVTQGLSALQSIEGFETGLHFNLTYAFGRKPALIWKSPAKALVALYWACLFSKKPMLERISEELRKQLETARALGLKITYLDGHHHVHVFPIISSAVAKVCREYGIQSVRVPFDPHSLQFSHWIIGRLARWAQPDFERAGIKALPFLYPSLKEFENPAKLRQKLLAHPGYEVLVHPADEDDVSKLPIPDSYSAQRVTEYRALLAFART
jgi:chitin disaccharide deacetylase